jgi:hypothetical protein
MGNRAVIKMEGQPAAIYLHWHGSIDTVKPLLDVAKEYRLRGDDYGIARLTQMFGNVIGGTISLGVSTEDLLDTDNFDNGTYVIDEEFNIIRREFMHHPDEGQTPEDYDKTVMEIKRKNDQFFLESKPNLDCGYCTVAGGAGAWACPHHGEDT